MAEALFALVHEALVSIVFLPPVDIPDLVVATQHENLVGEKRLERQKVGRALDAVLATVDVVAQEEELTCRQIHPELVTPWGEGEGWMREMSQG